MVATAWETNLDVAWSIPIGTPVHDADGAKIGTVRNAEIDALIVERGRFFVQEYTVDMSDVDRFERGRLVLKVTKASVLNGDHL